MALNTLETIQNVLHQVFAVAVDAEYIRVNPDVYKRQGTYSVVTVCLAEDGSGAAALFQSKDCLLYTSHLPHRLRVHQRGTGHH